MATLTKVFARELGPHGATVNAISPGPLDLPMVREMVPPDQLAAIEASSPVRRLGHPEFVAGMAVPYEAGVHIDVTGPTGITRPYSLCGPPGDIGAYTIAVKREDNSRGGSQALHDKAERVRS